MKYQCLFSMYYHYANSAVLSCNSQWSMFLYYHVLLFQISDDRQRTPGNWSELSRIRSIRPHTPQMMQNSHQLLTYLHYVSEACPGREPCRIPANYADSTRFAHTARESREFHTLRTKFQIYVIDFQISDHRQRTQENWSEPTTFCSIRPPITRIPRISQ